MAEFESFGKIPRYNREVVVTEKIDGTNAAILISDDLDEVAAQSRKRLITPADDNFGFASWVDENADRLVQILGPGRHFGEWWGKGIQRGYGLDEKRFSLFNVSRWQGDHANAIDPAIGLYVVPTLATYCHFPDSEWEIRRLRMVGSFAAPGFMRPEGIILYHRASNMLYKATLEGDEMPKSLALVPEAA